MDRISNLPDDLILHIWWFLSAKEAAFTTLLSKRWQNLLTIESDLVFDHLIHGSFQTFVAGLLARDPSDRVRRFSLKLRPEDFDPAQYSLVNDCLCNVLKRGVMDLELDINVREDYPLPLEVFTCRTVVKLKLGSGFVIDFIPMDALLPALKTLLLDSVRFNGLGDGCVFQRLISACPVLEELVIDGLSSDHWNWSRTVSSQILKRLTIRRNEWNNHGPDDNEMISFDTPSLEYLEYLDVLRDGYPVVNLNSLVEAKLQLPLLYVNDTYDLTNLIKGLKNVHILSLDNLDTLQLIVAFEEAVPVFENLSHLSVVTEPWFCWYALDILLTKSPNLKTLTIEGTLHYHDDYSRPGLPIVCECLSEYSFLVSCRIEVLKITEFKGDFREMVQIKHILQKLPCLELLEVHVQEKRHYQKMQIMSDLVMLPRASTKCKVQVKFS